MKAHQASSRIFLIFFLLARGAQSSSDSWSGLDELDELDELEEPERACSTLRAARQASGSPAPSSNGSGEDTSGDELEWVFCDPDCASRARKGSNVQFIESGSSEEEDMNLGEGKRPLYRIAFTCGGAKLREDIASFTGSEFLLKKRISTPITLNFLRFAEQITQARLDYNDTAHPKVADIIKKHFTTVEKYQEIRHMKSAPIVLPKEYRKAFRSVMSLMSRVHLIEITRLSDLASILGMYCMLRFKRASVVCFENMPGREYYINRDALFASNVAQSIKNLSIFRAIRPFFNTNIKRDLGSLNDALLENAEEYVRDNSEEEGLTKETAHFTFMVLHEVYGKHEALFFHTFCKIVHDTPGDMADDLGHVVASVAADPDSVSISIAPRGGERKGVSYSEIMGILRHTSAKKATLNIGRGCRHMSHNLLSALLSILGNTEELSIKCEDEKKETKIMARRARDAILRMSDHLCSLKQWETNEEAKAHG